MCTMAGSARLDALTIARRDDRSRLTRTGDTYRNGLAYALLMHSGEPAIMQRSAWAVGFLLAFLAGSVAAADQTSFYKEAWSYPEPAPTNPAQPAKT
jgi:hypothetical protein